MSEKSSFKIPLPAIAIALILIGGIAADRWLIKGPQAPAPEIAGEIPEDHMLPDEPEIEIVRTVKPPVGPIETPAVTAWSTYHGDSKLTGFTNATLPDKPELLWRFQAEGAIYHSPVADENAIYVCTLKGMVYALDSQGNPKWSRQLYRTPKADGTPRLERIDAPPSIFNDILYIGSLNGTVYALNNQTGDTIWKYEIDEPILGSISLHDDKSGGGPARLIVLGQDTGALFSLDPKSGEKIWQTESIDRCDGSASLGNGLIVFGSCAAAYHVFSAEDGHHIKDIPLDDDSQVASGAAMAGDSIFSGSHSGRLFHASLSTGEILWVNEDSMDEVFSTPAIGKELVIFGSFDGNIYALDRLTGERRWIYETDGYPTSAVIASDKVIVGVDGVLYFLELDTGKLLWSYEISDEIASPAIINNTVVIASEDGTVTAFGAK